MSCSSVADALLSGCWTVGVPGLPARCKLLIQLVLPRPTSCTGNKSRTLKLKQWYESNHLCSPLEDAMQYTWVDMGVVCKLEFGHCTRVTHGT